MKGAPAGVAAIELIIKKLAIFLSVIVNLLGICQFSLAKRDRPSLTLGIPRYSRSDDLRSRDHSLRKQ